MRGLAAVLAGGLLTACTPAALPRETPEAGALVAVEAGFVLRHANVMTAAGRASPRADLRVAGARILAVGPALAVPEGARVIDVAGRFVTPGLIDASSSIGAHPPGADRGDGAVRFDPEVRAADSFWSGDPALRYAVSGGVTTIRVRSRAVDAPAAGLVGGHGVTLRLRPGRSVEEMRFARAPETLDLSCGEPARLRRALRRARASAAGEAPPGHALGSQALARVLRGDTLIQSHCVRADEMLSQLELFAEFGIAPRAFHRALEAYKIADLLASAGVGAVLSADGSPHEATAAATALLERSGARVALQPDRPRDIQRLNQAAGFALAAGRRAGIVLERDRALRWITANPAWLLGIDDRVGTLEPGKDADLVVWSADPLSIYARADLVFIEGRLVYDRASPGLVPVPDFELGTRIDAP